MNRPLTHLGVVGADAADADDEYADDDDEECRSCSRVRITSANHATPCCSGASRLHESGAAVASSVRGEVDAALPTIDADGDNDDCDGAGVSSAGDDDDDDNSDCRAGRSRKGGRCLR
jgi:hypothetical protein